MLKSEGEIDNENIKIKRVKEIFLVDVGKYSQILVTILKTDGIISHKEIDEEDVIHSDNRDVTESCGKFVEITEKDKEMVNVITTLKGNECNEISSSIEESSANMNKEEDTCNKDNYNTLNYTQIENNTKENIGKSIFMRKIKIKKIVEKIKK